MARNKTRGKTINRRNLIDRVAKEFDPAALINVCQLDEDDFERAYGFTRVEVDQPAPNDFYLFQDNGANILAVAHLDTVADPSTRSAQVIETEGGPVVFSRALDDRLGAYILLHLLPALGVKVDILLTVGEEMGASTAAFFDTDVEYNWIIEFDRGGTDVVLYQYDDLSTRELVRTSGAEVSVGAFSDISFLDHLGVKAFNWGCGYRDYHDARSHAFLNDTFLMVGYFLRFYVQYSEEYLEHLPAEPAPAGAAGGWADWDESAAYAAWWAERRQRDRHWWDEEGDPMRDLSYAEERPAFLPAPL